MEKNSEDCQIRRVSTKKGDKASKNDDATIVDESRQSQYSNNAEDDLINSLQKMDFSSLNSTAVLTDLNTQADILSNIFLAQFELKDLRKKIEKLHPKDWSRSDLDKFNNGIVSVGVHKFLFTAAYLCKKEGNDGKHQIVSVGSGDGTVEKEIISEYRKRFKKNIRITLVDKNPMFKVDFKNVDELIEKRPSVVGNCVLFIIWPEPRAENDNYDIQAIHKLRPRAVLTIYEATSGAAGSLSLEKLLFDESLSVPSSEFGAYNFMGKFVQPNFDLLDYGLLKNYSIEEVTRQKIRVGPTAGITINRLVKMKRIE